MNKFYPRLTYLPKPILNILFVLVLISSSEPEPQPELTEQGILGCSPSLIGRASSSSNSVSNPYEIGSTLTLGIELAKGNFCFNTLGPLIFPIKAHTTGSEPELDLEP